MLIGASPERVDDGGERSGTGIHQLVGSSDQRVGGPCATFVDTLTQDTPVIYPVGVLERGVLRPVADIPGCWQVIFNQVGGIGRRRTVRRV